MEVRTYVLEVAERIDYPELADFVRILVSGIRAGWKYVRTRESGIRNLAVGR